MGHSETTLERGILYRLGRGVDELAVAFTTYPISAEESIKDQLRQSEPRRSSKLRCQVTPGSVAKSPRLRA